jgi:hypothetical protein
MPDNTNVNNNASVVVVGRTAPVPPGQQKSDKSVPVVIASDQSTIPVAEQNKVQSEVALSLLGIPRSEVALGIFADVNTYDVNPTEWAAEPDLFSTVGVGAGTPYGNVTQGMGWGLTHVPEESGALVEAPADKTAVLTSKRFFRYQPGRVSAATFGVKTTIMNIASTDANPSDTNDIGSTVYNPAVRKYGIFDNFDGYYWETRNNGQGDNFCVVRRTQSLLFNNPVDFATTGQTADFGATNPLDVLAPRGNETADPLTASDPNAQISFLPAGNLYPDGHDSTPAGYENVKLGDLVVYRDNLMMTHAGVYDPSILQDKQEYSIEATASNVLTFDCSNSASNSGLGRTISNAVYDIDTGLMTVTTNGNHGFAEGKFVHLSGIGMTCQYSYSNYDGTGSLVQSQIKTYPDRTHGYSILQVPSATSFVVNVGVSTVATFFNAEKSASNGAVVLGLSTSQYVSYSQGTNASNISGLDNEKIFRVNSISYSTATKKASVTLKELTTTMDSDGSYDPGKAQTAKSDITNSSQSGHKLITPVPFVQPVADNVIVDSGGGQFKKYGSFSVKPSGMFPYMYKDPDKGNEGYIDTTLDTSSSSIATLKKQIAAINLYYRNWINQNVKKDFWNVYEYRVPRSRYSGDRLDNATDDLLYSDVTATNRAGSNVLDTTTGANQTDTSIWDLEFDKVTMYKIEFSWYGAVGALFLAYVPVGAGEARWVRVHHLRASNQLKGSSLGNATLPITYMVYGGGGSTRFGYPDVKRTPTSFDYGSSSEHIIKYGASYYIDGGDRGTVKLFSHGTPTGVEVFGSKRTFGVGSGGTQITVDSNATNATDPYITGNASTSLGSSYYVGTKIITGNPLDQNVEVVYVDISNRRLHLNVPLASTSIPGSSLDLISNRPTPLIGLKCRDFITSSTGRQVRNRTQVYPTRLSTGSSFLIKVDLLKSPIFQTTSGVTGSFTFPANPDPTDTSKTTLNIGKRGKAFKINVTSSFLDDNNSGAYGYLRGVFQNDASQKVITVFGYLERRSSSSDYYFRAENPTNDNIVLTGGTVFLYEAQTTPVGGTITPTDNDFTLDALSSIKVSPETRAPIPKTGTIVASLFIPASGEEFDLSSYFDYNKEYLSFPLTNVVETLYVVGSSEGAFSGSAISTTNASITWEEQ